MQWYGMMISSNELRISRHILLVLTSAKCRTSTEDNVAIQVLSEVEVGTIQRVDNDLDV